MENFRYQLESYITIGEKDLGPSLKLEHVLPFVDSRTKRTHCNFAKVITLKDQGHWLK